MKARGALLAAFLMLAGCAQFLPRYAVPSGAHATGFYENIDRPDLALLEYRLAEYFDRSSPPYSSVCAVAARFAPEVESPPVPLDPQTESKLLRRFPLLRPASECERNGRAIVNRATGAPAALFDVHELECETPVRCSAWGGYYGAGQHGWNWYWLEWNGGQWTIRPRDLEIVLT